MLRESSVRSRREDEAHYAADNDVYRAIVSCKNGMPCDARCDSMQRAFRAEYYDIWIERDGRLTRSWPSIGRRAVGARHVDSGPQTSRRADDRAHHPVLTNDFGLPSDIIETKCPSIQRVAPRKVARHPATGEARKQRVLAFSHCCAQCRLRRRFCNDGSSFSFEQAFHHSRFGLGDTTKRCH